MMQMVGAFAEFERAMLRERTKAGLALASRSNPTAFQAVSFQRADFARVRMWRRLSVCCVRTPADTFCRRQPCVPKSGNAAR